MGHSQHLLGATFLFGLLFFKGIAMGSITVKQQKNNISLTCNEKNKMQTIEWKKDGKVLNHKNAILSLGDVLDDPRGVFECNNETLQVFVRMCQNCIRLDIATILGILLASIVATFFLAVGVYCIAAGESSQRSQASDKQTLLANEQLYQPLGERNNGQYSHIGVAKTRHR